MQELDLVSECDAFVDPSSMHLQCSTLSTLSDNQQNGKTALQFGTTVANPRQADILGTLHQQSFNYQNLPSFCRFPIIPVQGFVIGAYKSVGYSIHWL